MKESCQHQHPELYIELRYGTLLGPSRDMEEDLPSACVAADVLICRTSPKRNKKLMSCAHLPRRGRPAPRVSCSRKFANSDLEVSIISRQSPSWQTPCCHGDRKREPQPHAPQMFRCLPSGRSWVAGPHENRNSPSWNPKSAPPVPPVANPRHPPNIPLSELARNRRQPGMSHGRDDLHRTLEDLRFGAP